jgi:hypothetical protein
MQWDAGVIGRRMTAAENAIDAAVLEWPARPSPRQSGANVQLLCTAVGTAAHELLELNSGRSLGPPPAPDELWRCSEEQQRAEREHMYELLHDCSHVDACAWFVCSVLCAS